MGFLTLESRVHGFAAKKSKARTHSSSEMTVQTKTEFILQTVQQPKNEALILAW